MFSISMLNGFWDVLINWFSGLFYFLSVGVYYLIIGGIGKLVDIMQLLFRKFAGLDGISLNGEEGDIVLQFINSSRVQQVFIAMLVLAVVLIFITSFVAVIKTEFNKSGNNNKKVVLKNAIRGVANFVIVPIVCVFGVIVGNALLNAIDGATKPEQSATISGQMFVAGGYNSNRVRQGENTGENASGYAKGTVGSWVTGGEKNGIGYGSFGIFKDDTTGLAKKSAADYIDNAFATNLTINLSNLSTEEKTLIYAGGESGEFAYVYLNYFSLGAFPWGHNTFNYNIDGINGVTLESNGYNKDNTTLTFSIYNVGLVSYYYDLSLFTYDYLVASIALIFCIYIFAVTLLGLIKRLFMIVTLFIISPPICALYPLDEGKALGLWRTEFIKQTLSAYSVVIILNIFFLLLPLFLQLEVITVVPNAYYSGMGLSVAFINYIARILIICGALLFFKDATNTVSKIIGAGDAFGDDLKDKKGFIGGVKAIGEQAIGIGAISRGKGGNGGGGNKPSGSGPSGPSGSGGSGGSGSNETAEALAQYQGMSGKASNNNSPSNGNQFSMNNSSSYTDASNSSATSANFTDSSGSWTSTDTHKDVKGNSLYNFSTPAISTYLTKAEQKAKAKNDKQAALEISAGLGHKGAKLQLGAQKVGRGLAKAGKVTGKAVLKVGSVAGKGALNLVKGSAKALKNIGSYAKALTMSGYALATGGDAKDVKEAWEKHNKLRQKNYDARQKHKQEVKEARANIETKEDKANKEQQKRQDKEIKRINDELKKLTVVQQQLKEKTDNLDEKVKNNKGKK